MYDAGGNLVSYSELDQLKDKYQLQEDILSKEYYGTSEPTEAYEYAKTLLAGGGRVRMASGGIVNLLKL